jgi:hypothetical protein
MKDDYTSDDSQMYGLYKEGLEYLHQKNSGGSPYPSGREQFTPKLKTRGDPNRRLSYASYFEEDGDMIQAGVKATYLPDGSEVNVVEVYEKEGTATIELPDESILYDVSVDDLQELF